MLCNYLIKCLLSDTWSGQNYAQLAWWLRYRYVDRAGWCEMCILLPHAHPTPPSRFAHGAVSPRERCLHDLHEPSGCPGCDGDGCGDYRPYHRTLRSSPARAEHGGAARPDAAWALGVPPPALGSAQGAQRAIRSHVTPKTTITKMSSASPTGNMSQRQSVQLIMDHASLIFSAQMRNVSSATRRVRSFTSGCCSAACRAAMRHFSILSAGSLTR